MKKVFKRLSVYAITVLMALPGIVLAQTGTPTPTPAMTDSGHMGMMGKHIGQNTKTGKVSAISGSSITLAGNDGGTYTVDASAAKLVRRYGAAMQLTDIQTGDTLQVTGTVSGTSIAAKTIRDISLQAKNGSFSGKVTAVNGSSFTVDTGRGSQTANTSSTTIYKKNGQADSNGLADVTVGTSVRISGVWDRTNSNITANTVNVIIRMVSVNITGSLTGISGSTLTVQGTNSTTYTVDATNAKVYYKGWHKGDLTILTTGDQVQFYGKHVDGSASVTASRVRDLSKTYQKTTGSTVTPTPTPTTNK